MIPLDLLMTEQLRGALRAQFAAMPEPAAAAMADELADLTFHAASEALVAVDRIARRAPNEGASLAVLSATLSVCRHNFKVLEATLVGSAEAAGATVHRATISLGGGRTMKPIGLEVPEGLRADLRRQFATAPAPMPAIADELADLAFHGVNEALAAIDRTAARAPSDIARLMVLSIAMMTAAEALKTTNTELLAGALAAVARQKAGRSAR